VVRKGNAATVATIEQQLTLACTLATNLATIASEYHLVRAAPALCGCVTLPLECGHALMTRAAVSGSEISRDTADILQNQARLLASLMAPHLGHRALAAQLAAPEPLLAWLSAAASTTLALHGPLHGRGEWFVCWVRGSQRVLVLTTNCVANILILSSRAPLGIRVSDGTPAPYGRSAA
jgi:hypothetical protein